MRAGRNIGANKSRLTKPSTYSLINRLKRYHKLLHAIAKTRELESQDNTKTHYDRSLARIVSAYSKIKT